MKIMVITMIAYILYVIIIVIWLMNVAVSWTSEYIYAFMLFILSLLFLKKKKNGRKQSDTLQQKDSENRVLL